MHYHNFKQVLVYQIFKYFPEAITFVLTVGCCSGTCDCNGLNCDGWRHGFASISANLLHVVSPHFCSKWYVIHLSFNQQRILGSNNKRFCFQRGRHFANCYNRDFIRVDSANCNGAFSSKFHFINSTLFLCKAL